MWYVGHVSLIAVAAGTYCCTVGLAFCSAIASSFQPEGTMCVLVVSNCVSDLHCKCQLLQPATVDAIQYIFASMLPCQGVHHAFIDVWCTLSCYCCFRKNLYCCVCNLLHSIYPTLCSAYGMLSAARIDSAHLSRLHGVQQVRSSIAAGVACCLAILLPTGNLTHILPVLPVPATAHPARAVGAHPNMLPSHLSVAFTFFLVDICC